MYYTYFCEIVNLPRFYDTLTSLLTSRAAQVDAWKWGVTTLKSSGKVQIRITIYELLMSTNCWETKAKRASYKTIYTTQSV